MNHQGRCWMVCAALLLLLLLGACRSPNQGAGKTNPQKQWGVLVGERVQSRPAVGADGTVYVGVSNQTLYAFQPNGRFLWKYKGKGIVQSPAVTADNIVIATTSDGFVFALDSYGRAKWNRQPRKRLFGCTPAITKAGQVFVAGDLVLAGYTIKTGKPYLLGKKMPLIKTCPVVNDKDQLFYSDGTKIVGYDVVKKKQIVSFPLKGRVAGPVFDKAGNLIFAAARGEILSYSPAGKLLWSFKAKPRKRTKFTIFDFLWPQVSPTGDIVVTRRNEGIYCLSSKGKKKWFFPNPRQTFSGRLSITSKGTIFATNRDGSVYALSPSGKVKFDFRTNDWVLFGSRLSRDEKTLYLGSFDKHLYAIHTDHRPKK